MRSGNFHPPATGTASGAQTPVPEPAPPSAGDGKEDLRASLKRLRVVVNGRLFALKLALCAVLTAAGITAALQQPLWLRCAGIVLTGCMFAHAAELQHQTLHGLGFRGRRANTVAGIALGVPMLISFAAYRVAHLRHHRYLGTPLNREFFDYGDQYGAEEDRNRLRTALDWLVRFSMLHHYALFLRNLFSSLRGRDFEGETATTSRRIRRDHLVVLAAFVAMTALSFALGRPVVVLVWALPLVLVAAPVHAAIELPEHYGCETLDEDAFANTRTIRSNRFMYWFTNGNNFHVEHHLLPNLPIERLPEAHVLVRDRLRYFHSGYGRFFYRLLRK